MSQCILGTFSFVQITQFFRNFLLCFVQNFKYLSPVNKIIVVSNHFSLNLCSIQYTKY